MRLRGVKIKSSRQRELGLNADLFQPASLVRYPRLEGTDPEVLYRRAVLLQRWLWPWACQALPFRSPILSMSEILYYKLFNFKRQSSPWALAATVTCVLGIEGVSHPCQTL